MASRIMACLAFFVVLAGAVGVSKAPAHEAHNSTLPAKTIDLASGRLGGRPVLGRTVAGVTAALGRPDQRVPGVARYTLRYEPTSPRLGNWGVQILFRRDHRALRAWSIVVADPSFREPRIGMLLRLAPSALEKAVMADYGDRYSILRPYHCTTKPRQCRGELGPTGEGRLGLGIGALTPSGRTYAVLYG